MVELKTPPPAFDALPEALPPSAWLEAEQRLDLLAARLDEVARTAQKDGLDAIRHDLLDPFRTVVQRAAQVHRRLLDAVAFDIDVEPDALWQEITAYRDGVRADVVEPLQTHLAEADLGQALGERFTTMLDGLAALVEEVPRHLELPEPSGLLATDPDDASLLRLRKRLTHARRRLGENRLRLANRARRLFRQSPQPLTPRNRLVPVRLLVNHHLRVRLPTVFLPLHETVQQETAQNVQLVEAALTAWLHSLLDAEREIDAPAFHRPAPLVAFSAVTPPAIAPELPTRLQQIGEALQAALDAVAADVSPRGPALTQLDEAADALADDLLRGGTFLLDPAARTLPPADRLPSAPLQARRHLWAQWHTQARSRLVFQQHLLTLRRDLLGIEDTLLLRTAEAALVPILTAFSDLAEHLRAAQQQAEAACDDARHTPDLTVLAKTLRNLQAEVTDQLQRMLRDVPGLVSADHSLRAPGAPEESQKQHIVAHLPDDLGAHLVPPVELGAVEPVAHRFRLDLRAIATEALAPPLPDRLPREAAALRGQILNLWSEAEHVLDIVQFNLSAAADELTAAEKEGRPRDTVLAAARELATDGLGRAADSLDELATSLRTPWQTFADAVYEQFRDDWEDLHRRARSEAVREEQWAGFRMRLTRQAERLRLRGDENWRKGLIQATRLLQSGQRQAQQLIEKGRTAVGVGDMGEQNRFLTLDALADAHRLRAAQPLVYRKLFTFDPVAEPFLLEGRTADLDRVQQHFDRWRGGHSAGALVLILPAGAGRTSLLQVLQHTTFKRADVHLLDLPERVGEAAFAARLAATLRLPETLVSLEEIEMHLMDAPHPAPPVVLLDNLEHLLLRAPGGTDLLERILIFLSRTDSRVYWVGTIGTFPWRFVEKTCAGATGLVAAFTPAVPDRTTLEAVVVGRHRRSGLPLRFAEPPDPSPWLRQRLRRTRTPEDRQALLRNDFFERLHRLSGHNIRLALFYWLRAVDFEAEPGALHVRPLQPLDFGFLTRLDPARAFTLNAFLLHRTLTLSEHNRIFRLADAQSTFLLESLLNGGLIEPTHSDASVTDGRRILPHARYRLHPLLLHPIREYLRSLHLVY